LSQVVGGRYRAQGTFRASRVGSWFVLSDQEGQLRGGLRLNSLDKAETQRLQAVLPPVPGLLNVVDQVRDGSAHWLITAAPATPTVAEALQARIGLAPPVALMIAIETAQTLVALHDAGTAHGGLTADTVIVSREGRVVLAECGYAHALAGTHTGPGHDTTGWVKLLRAMATPRGSDDAKRLLNAAADEAEALGGKDGLATALTNLSHQAIRIAGYGDRSGLAMLASLVPATAGTAAPIAAALSEATTYQLEDGETVALAPPKGAAKVAPPAPAPPPKGAAKVAPHPPSFAAPPPASFAAPPPEAQTAILRDPAAEELTMPPAQLHAQMNRQKDEVLRFGRGVAPLPQQQRRPPLTDTGWPGDLPRRPMKRPKPWRARVLGFMSAAVTLVLVAWVGYQIIQRLVPLRVDGVTVALAEPLGDKCDVQAKVVGTIRTNAAAGTISYRWLTSDGKTTSILNEQVNLGTSRVQVPLLWTFSGRSTIRAKATLNILTPSEVEASTEFTYSCK
jgi:hypothetical protein